MSLLPRAQDTHTPGKGTSSMSPITGREEASAWRSKCGTHPPPILAQYSPGHARGLLSDHHVAPGTPEAMGDFTQAASLPVRGHLQAEAGLHLHELLVVPQPVSHGQGEGCLLILQAGYHSLKRTKGF